MFDNIVVQVLCRDCGHATGQRLAWLKRYATLACDGCGRDLDLRAPAVLAMIAAAENEIAAMAQASRPGGPLPLSKEPR